MATGAGKLYSCSGCWDPIPTNRARIACRDCTDVNLCTNCYVLDHFPTTHSKSHETTVVRESGHMAALPPKMANFTLAPPPTPDEWTRRASEIPTANWGALWDVMKAPLVKMDKKDKKSAKPAMRVQTAVPQCQSTTCSPLSRTVMPHSSSPPISGNKISPSIEFPTPIYVRPENWEPFFDEDFGPTPTFIALMNTIFNCLDDQGTGYLTPETYANFLEMQGYPLSANTWKMAWKKAAGASSKDIADLELGLYFSERDICHILVARPAGNGTKKPVQYEKRPNREAARRESIIKVDESMPLLSRQGFIDICAFEYLKDPAMAHQYLMNVLQELGVWKELGDLPRSVLPAYPRIPSFSTSQEIEMSPPPVAGNLAPKNRPRSSTNSSSSYPDSCRTSPTSSVESQKEHLPKPVPNLELAKPAVVTRPLHQDFFKPPPIIQRVKAHHRSNSGLILRTDIRSDWPPPRSPVAMSARTPHRRKVETLIEAYEQARKNITFTDEKAASKEGLLSPRHIPKPLASPLAFSFSSGDFPSPKRPPGSVLTKLSA